MLNSPGLPIRVLLNYRQKPQLALLIYLGSLHLRVELRGVCCAKSLRVA
jgi:hypothetical protein